MWRPAPGNAKTIPSFSKSVGNVDKNWMKLGHL